MGRAQTEIHHFSIAVIDRSMGFATLYPSYMLLLPAFASRELGHSGHVLTMRESACQQLA
jgi:hypothetical protein